jgi:hypothetical protein
MVDGTGSLELGPTYKTLFLGACVVIGGAVGWFVQDIRHSVDELTREHYALLDRQRELETGASAYKCSRERDHVEDTEIKRRLAEIEQELRWKSKR